MDNRLIRKNSLLNNQNKVQSTLIQTYVTSEMQNCDFYAFNPWTLKDATIQKNAFKSSLLVSWRLFLNVSPHLYLKINKLMKVLCLYYTFSVS